MKASVIWREKEGYSIKSMSFAEGYFFFFKVIRIDECRMQWLVCSGGLAIVHKREENSRSVQSYRAFILIISEHLVFHLLHKQLLSRLL